MLGGGWVVAGGWLGGGWVVAGWCLGGGWGVAGGGWVVAGWCLGGGWGVAGWWLGGGREVERSMDVLLVYSTALEHH